MKIQEKMPDKNIPHSDGGNSATLTKVDKLRELVGAKVSLPQLVVVGDQSSGKSSVLEGLTGFAFPRSAELCTRYATQITCHRDDHEGILISIIPHADAAPNEAAHLKKFCRAMTGVSRLDDEELAAVFRDANSALGIGEGSTGSAFSEHILKIEISGPQQDHFTVIDVPGIFRKETAGVTTEGDIALVRNMVMTYMQDSRTVILAIIPANVDPATQEILKLARKVDPEGLRTMGVLTKPDLAIEKAMQKIAIDHVTGRRSDLNLGYYIVKNRGPDDDGLSLEEGRQSELAFFSQSPWSELKATKRAGMAYLKQQVHTLLDSVIKQEFPKLRTEISSQLAELQSSMAALGASRSDPHSQRAYLGTICERFQTIARDALNANYNGQLVFNDDSFRLITRIVELDDRFSEAIRKEGHQWDFEHEGKDEFPTPSEPPKERRSSSHTKIDGMTKMLHTICPDVSDLWTSDQMSPVRIGALENTLTKYHEEVTSGGDGQEGSPKNILEYIKKLYDNSRAADLGTFSSSILGATFKEQTRKWEALTMAYVRVSIMIVQKFISNAMEAVCSDKDIREEINCYLSDAIEACYAGAEENAKFLINIERLQNPFTLNHYFSENLDGAQSDRMLAKITEMLDLKDPMYNEAVNRTVTVSQSKLRDIAKINQSSAEHTHAYIHDVLHSYYKVAAKRFVDNVCLQAVHHHLLFSPDGPLAVFSSRLVHSLDDDQLALIAGESPAIVAQRERLGREIANFKEALAVLRGRTVGR